MASFSSQIVTRSWCCMAQALLMQKTNERKKKVTKKKELTVDDHHRDDVHNNYNLPSITKACSKWWPLWWLWCFIIKAYSKNFSNVA